MTGGRVTGAAAGSVAAAASLLLLLVAGCTDVVNTGTVINAQTADAADLAPTPDGSATLEEICTGTGGHVEVRTCCDTDDFAGMCWNGSCCAAGASSQVTKEVRLCVCPQFYCFSPMAPSAGFRAGCNYQEMSNPRPDAAAERAF